ncbi:hypothetical protein PHLCEN_2v11639 [Hermanssonia centrifuga]|uniref:DUF6532 domain-containing protein n=1 Tax=Hermanssonia centrifuga TaxID=98765 RepID=A0A2R6NJR5_9APHY|nr:hypothetical protein PHLCEN_2v11639 [Hermanssonia centrifuga]
MPRSRRVLSSDESGSEDEAANVNSKKANKKSLHIAGETPMKTTKHVRKANEKQLYSDTRVEQAKENEQGKQIKKLQHELDRLKKQKCTAQHTNDNDSSRLGDKDMSDLSPESEKEDNYVSPMNCQDGSHVHWLQISKSTTSVDVPLAPILNIERQAHQRRPQSSQLFDAKDPRCKRPHPQSPSPSVPKELEFDVMHYTQGRIPDKGRPKEGDYSKLERILLKAGIKKFLLKIYTVHPFPANEMALGWAATTWSDICTQVRKNFSQQDSDHIMKRASSARGHLHDEISELIVEFYKIKLETEREKVHKENEQHIHYLMEGSPKQFCYKVEFCLDTWATREFNSQVMFKKSEYCPRYKKCLEQLKQWEEINSVVVQKIREKMFEHIV